MAKSRAKSKEVGRTAERLARLSGLENPPPFTAQQWHGGLDQFQWAASWDYDRLVRAMNSDEGPVFITSEPGSHCGELHFPRFEAIQKFRQDLACCVERGECTLAWRERRGGWDPIPTEAVCDIVELLDFGISRWSSPGTPFDQVDDREIEGRKIRVRIFRPGRFRVQALRAEPSLSPRDWLFMALDLNRDRRERSEAAVKPGSVHGFKGDKFQRVEQAYNHLKKGRIEPTNKAIEQILAEDGWKEKSNTIAKYAARVREGERAAR